MTAEALMDEFARDVRAGLTQAGQKSLPCRYLYDAVGSTLFDAIHLLPEYGLARAEARLIEALAAELESLLPAKLMVAEFGGRGAKSGAILQRLNPRGLTEYVSIDLPAAAVADCTRELADLCARREPGVSLLVLCLGGTISNFEPDQAVDFLYEIRKLLSPGDLVLLGTDLVKPAKQLLDAYDDPTGVTAAFHLNLLGRINRELEADFDLRQFAHVIRYHEEAQRVEIHLRSRAYQIVSVRKADLIVDFAPEETICTGAIHTYHAAQIRGMAEVSGFELARQWVDAEWGFAENLLTL